MIEELKCCPFCGSNDIEVKKYYDDGWYWFVTCKNCKAEKIHQFKGVAIQNWNTRPVEDVLRVALTKIAELCSVGGFISTDAKFKIIKHTAEKALKEK